MSSHRFTNPWPHAAQSFRSILKWKFGFGEIEQPLFPDAGDAPAEWQSLNAREISEIPPSGWKITWLGHASFLVQGCGLSLLIDPIFSDYCSPFPMKSLRRKVPPPCKISDLPKIDAVLLTHSHYDHLDLPTLKALGKETPLIISEGHAEWLRKKKHFQQVQEVKWHDRISINPEVSILATPAQHFTARSVTDRNQGHWCGWLIEGAGCKLWHTGDSGYCPAFKEIGERYGPIDFGMIPIGAYQPRSIMRPLHMNPEEAVRAFQDAQCHRAVGMHWGTFVLTDEPFSEPPLRLKRELAEKNLPDSVFTTGKIGESWQVHGQEIRIKSGFGTKI